MPFKHLNRLEEALRTHGFQVTKLTVGNNTHYFGITHPDTTIANPENIRYLIEDYEEGLKEKLRDKHEIEITEIPSERHLKSMKQFDAKKEQIRIILARLQIFNDQRPQVVIRFRRKK